MGRPVYYIENKSPDKAVSLAQWAGGILEKIKEIPEKSKSRELGGLL